MTMEFGSDSPYRLLGVVPNGRPNTKRPDRWTAIPEELVGGNEEKILRAANKLVLSVTGRRGTLVSDIDPGQFHGAIREFYPLGYYERSPNQAISRLDEKHYACRVAHRLLNQIEGRLLVLQGGYWSEKQTDVRAEAILREVRRIAADRGVDLMVR